MKKSYITVFIIILVLFFDQWLKIYVKTNFPLEQGFDIMGLPWAKIKFVENKGMAFGIEFAGEYGKLFLSMFRIFVVGLLIYFFFKSIKSNKTIIELFGIALVIAGAIGNIIDGTFYGILFSQSDYYHSAVAFPSDHGYAPLLHGKVVDMLYFPIIDTQFPEWIPFWGGKDFQFNNYIFNIADAAITVGVVILLFSYKRSKNKSLAS